MQGLGGFGDMGQNQGSGQGGMQDSQSILALLQQINLYKNILAQISYQNQILGKNINEKPNSNNNKPE